MSLFTEIQNDILSDKSISVILRRARVVAYQLKNQNFSNWIESELNGYSNEKDLPDYRIIPSPILGNFIGATLQINNAPVSMAHFPKELKPTEKIKIGDGVAKIEEDIQVARKANKDELIKDISSDISKYFKYGADPLLICIGAWKVITRQQLVQILETVRDRLQKFILELSDLHPEQQITKNPTILQSQINQLMQIVILGSNSSFTGSISMETKEGDMAIFDQKHQTVGYQYNAAGNINIDNIKSRENFINELEKLKIEITKASQAKVIDREAAAKAEQKLEKAIQNSKKSKPNKKTVLKYIKETAEILSSIPALVNLATEITKAGKLALELFSS